MRKLVAGRAALNYDTRDGFELGNSKQGEISRFESRQVSSLLFPPKSVSTQICSAYVKIPSMLG